MRTTDYADNMTTESGPGQKLIGIPMNEKFIEKIDESLRSVGYSNRSSFIRDAIVEKLKRGNVKIDASLSYAPSRAGKGGRPPKTAVSSPKTKK